MKFLITGFDCFNNDKINPSIEAVKMLPDEIEGAVIIKKELPTVFFKSVDILFDEIDKHNPDYVICVGVAGGRTGITPERIGVNIILSGIPDNEGNKLNNSPVVPGANDAYFSNLPNTKIVDAIRASGIPSYISESAGTYVCNHLLFSLMNKIRTEEKYKHIKGGFIHVPYIPEMVININREVPSLTLEQITLALYSAISACVQCSQNDLK